MSVFRVAWFMYTAEKSLVLSTGRFVCMCAEFLFQNAYVEACFFFFFSGKNLEEGLVM